MKYLFSITLLVSLLWVSVSCHKADPFAPSPNEPVDTTGNINTDTLPATDIATIKKGLTDKEATDETAALFYNLKKTAQNNILFGHQDDTKRGYGWANEQGQSYNAAQSDVKAVTGSYPAVYGSDFLQYVSFYSGAWYDYEKETSRSLAVDAYNRGGIVTYSWHYANPVSKGSFYWSQSPIEAVSHILPGGDSVEVFKSSLKTIADFAKSLVGSDGKLVPVIFRPWHENDGDWFWWGKGHCTVEQYKKLYQFTVSYLRDSLGVHNFLYAWSPGGENTTEAQYLTYYPGDEWVDVLGTDNYSIASTSASMMSSKLKIVSDYADRKNKAAAFTETGSTTNLAETNWYSDMLLKALIYQKLKMAYVMVWDNTKDHFYTPYKGHTDEADFIKFYNTPYVLFGNKTPAMYTLN